MGDSMKRTAVILGILLGILSLAVWAQAQTTTGQPAQTPPAAGQTAPPAGTTPDASATPAAKRPPQAKTQPEFDAWKAASAATDAPGLEKASDDFATKFPDSELRVLLYKNAMRLYQNANNAEKTEAMGRKVLTFDADDPEALVTVAEVIAERTRDSDLDKDQRYGDAVAMAKKATETVDTDVQVPTGTPQEKIDAYKALLRSNAYSILGTIAYKKDDFVTAQDNLQKSIDAFPSNPDPVVVLRLALAIDKQGTAASGDQQAKLYAQALKVANRAVELTQENTAIGTPARSERDRLQKLTQSAGPAQAATPPKN
jgi:tetratricopeptide (TPR) repeat protein